MQDDKQIDRRRYSCLTSEIDGAYHMAALKCGVSDSAMRILYTICLYGDQCLLSDIVQLSGVSKQTINSALRKLEQQGAVYLEQADGKKKLVCLTAQGKQLAQRSAMRVLQMEDEIFDGWSQDDCETFFRLIERFLTAFREKVQAMDRSDAVSP